MQATTEKQVEIRTVAQPESDSQGENGSAAQDIRHRIARRAAKELKNGFHVNLGIGMPTLVPEHLPPDVKVWLQSENGILGMGPYPTEKQLDACEPLPRPFLLRVDFICSETLSTPGKRLSHCYLEHLYLVSGGAGLLIVESLKNKHARRFQ